MRTLALDVGTRRTGVALLDDEVGFPIPLDTIAHQSQKELHEKLLELIAARKITRVIVGLPRLPSGEEGAQAAISRAVGTELERSGMTVSFVDERYSTPRTAHHKNVVPASNYDGDAAAACSLFSQKIDC